MLWMDIVSADTRAAILRAVVAEVGCTADLVLDQDVPEVYSLSMAEAPAPGGAAVPADLVEHAVLAKVADGTPAAELDETFLTALVTEETP